MKPAPAKKEAEYEAGAVYELCEGRRSIAWFKPSDRDMFESVKQCFEVRRLQVNMETEQPP